MATLSELPERKPESSRATVTRREALSKGVRASAGAALLWSSPSISTMNLAQASTTSPPQTNISFVALLLVCGDGNTYRTKFDREDGTFTQECGTSFSVDHCPEDQQLEDPDAAPVSCPPVEDEVSAVLEPDGSVTVSLGSCVVKDNGFVVKCGTCCFEENEGGQPDAPAAGSITFPPCTSTDCPS